MIIITTFDIIEGIMLCYSDILLML